MSCIPDSPARRRLAIATRLAFWLSCFLAFGPAAAPAIAADLVGPVVHIRDGDTFVMRAGDRLQPIRLCGVDTPERGQTGYRPASAALQALIDGRAVRCVPVGAGTPCDRRSPARSHDRVVAQCFIDGADVAALMVRAGHACAWPKFSGNEYRILPTTCVKGE